MKKLIIILGTVIFVCLISITLYYGQKKSGSVIENKIVNLDNYIFSETKKFGFNLNARNELSQSGLKSKNIINYKFSLPKSVEFHGDKIDFDLNKLQGWRVTKNSYSFSDRVLHVSISNK